MLSFKMLAAGCYHAIWGPMPVVGLQKVLASWPACLSGRVPGFAESCPWAIRILRCEEMTLVSAPQDILS